MARDYAKPSKSTRRVPGSKKKSSKNRGLWLIVLLLIAGLMVSLYHLHQKKWPQLHKKISQVETVVAKQAPNTTATPPRFEFYGMLANNKTTATVTPPPPSVATVNNSIAVKKPAVPVISSVSTATPKMNGYILQIASFKESKPADQLKAKLVLHGIDAKIIKLSAQGASWYRVITGPYKDPTAADKTLKTLHNLGYKPILHNQAT